MKERQQPRSRKPRCQPTGILPDDFYVSSFIPPCRKTPATRIIVTDDWPDDIPVTEAELRCFEAFFGDFLDELLRPSD